MTEDEIQAIVDSGDTSAIVEMVTEIARGYFYRHAGHGIGFEDHCTVDEVRVIVHRLRRYEGPASKLIHGQLARARSHYYQSLRKDNEIQPSRYAIGKAKRDGTPIPQPIERTHTSHADVTMCPEVAAKLGFTSYDEDGLTPQEAEVYEREKIDHAEWMKGVAESVVRQMPAVARDARDRKFIQLLLDDATPTDFGRAGFTFTDIEKRFHDLDWLVANARINGRVMAEAA